MMRITAATMAPPWLTSATRGSACKAPVERHGLRRPGPGTAPEPSRRRCVAHGGGIDPRRNDAAGSGLAGGAGGSTATAMRTNAGAAATRAASIASRLNSASVPVLDQLALELLAPEPRAAVRAP